ncbi:MAG: ribonuclease P protein component [Candidatus Buchananbacteria bacterium RIFCSPHIGHO2_02_FULL_45_11b]|uniref:Ribonuclease P protein component n=4 Tax=Candidatus Buchananiibacteriota TaxID=1817903 RepID=A0A1G1YPD7_9BACT|nr:MAG: ribonuclease P protein component [Candidatus Buchananbacteria bacterium RIFCSPHIGHO2_01_FULL_46_12]OGY50761.1 MAG: ribonuclease P protein component [Candidatus Buchananbacteria bacterium RIFCSPHIGHO2_02_FULL_45_11b]OGY53307.1 MAG: ribonuclease P protein component [Candidatus Buchananbacteria bacterium RIFCSPLOWO2_01_FULL_45_31]OGY55754.1 MAG: ribonuclease P protein component [Candidatus Buchananbacteria bacterium RIFCSPLOWO2_02_FULL_46_11b]
MLPVKYRLTQDRDFKRINAGGKSVFSAYFRLRYLANKLPNSRFAVVVSTKISKKATIRNRLKRQTREILRLNREKIKDGFDLIISVQNRALGRDYEELKTDLAVLFFKGNLLK